MQQDNQCGPGQDPTVNVKNSMEAAVKRLDDLREQDARHVREILKLRTSRNDDLRNAESRYLRDTMALRAGYDKRLRDAETERIDAIRQVDVSAVAAAAAVQATQANTLAGTVTTSAEAMRAQVAAAAAAQTVALKAETDPLRKDIADLRQVQYETAGGKANVIETRESTADLKPMLDAIAELTRAQNMQRGVQETRTDSRAGTTLMVAVAGTFLLALALGVSFAALVMGR